MKSEMNIFLLIGQSNMAGRGAPGEVASLQHPNIRMFRDGQWVQAETPLHTDKPEIAGVGPAMSFAVEMLKQDPDAIIGLVPCAVGGTPLSRWMPGADLYNNAVAAAREALSFGTLKGILWHQGEADSHTQEDAETYGQRLEEMIAVLRADLAAPEVPFIAGELGAFICDYDDGCDFFEIVNNRLRQLSETVPLYACVSAADLKDKGDHIHFDSASSREFGERYAREYLRIDNLLEEQLK